jgi:diguanylate cyclase (GGDEF)-like protein
MTARAKKTTTRAPRRETKTDLRVTDGKPARSTAAKSAPAAKTTAAAPTTKIAATPTTKTAATPTTKTAATPTSKTAARAAAPTTPKGQAAAEWAKNQVRTALELMDSLEERGLLSRDEKARLAEQLEEISVEPNAEKALGRYSAFQKKLAGLVAPGADGRAPDRERGVEALFEISRQIARLHDATEAAERLLAIVAATIPCEGATLHLVEAGTGRLKVAATAGPETDLIDRIEFEGGTGFSGWVARTQKPILFGSLKKSQPAHAGVVKSFLAAPMVVAGETIGVLTLGHSRENAFTRDDLRLVVMIGTQAAALLQKSRFEARLREVAIHDPATGLYNRSHFQLRIQDEAARAGRFRHEFAIIRVSLPEFPEYRDMAGVDSANGILAEMASILNGLARSTDLVARLGDADFALLLPVTGLEEARAAADRLARGVESHVFPRRKRMRAVTGVATFPGDGTGAQELLECADNALESARQGAGTRPTEIPAVSA